MDKRTAQFISEVEEGELTEEDMQEFEEISNLVKSKDREYPIPDGTAIRRNNKKGSVDVITAIYPISHGNRYVKYRIDISGDKDKLVKKEIWESIPSI